MNLVTPSRGRFRAASLAALVVIAGLACNPSSPLTQGARLDKDQTLRVLLDDQPASLEPGQTQYAYETAVLPAITEPLLRPTADLSGVTPAAAQSLDLSRNGLIHPLHLRHAAHYRERTPVKAHD